MTPREWKSALLHERILDIKNVKFVLKGNNYANYGDPDKATNTAIHNAIRHHEYDELDSCEYWCERAERAQIAGIRRLCNKPRR